MSVPYATLPLSEWGAPEALVDDSFLFEFLTYSLLVQWEEAGLTVALLLVLFLKRLKVK